MDRVAWIVVIVLIAWIVFTPQNMRSVEASLLGMHGTLLGMRGTLPVAMAMLIPVGGILLTLVVGTARITQLRRRPTRGRRR